MGAGMPDKLWAIDFDGMIGGNGSYVECDGHVETCVLLSHKSADDFISVKMEYADDRIAA